MSTNREDNAFPIFNQHGDCLSQSAAGLTKREYFAGLIMQGLAPTEGASWGYLAAQAVRAADDLIEALNK